ncbi:hypothetical protein E2C01_069584 [Portunus trituberculatus]|uniref:Uncharacterized protein n=1 Tax=Portunus trituberculatus TaxID=210409 RepID=A0A5B7HRY1_PORTR|nr:hypothetical protein [Portunus trituberculatus]
MHNGLAYSQHPQDQMKRRNMLEEQFCWCRVHTEGLEATLTIVQKLPVLCGVMKLARGLTTCSTLKSI